MNKKKITITTAILFVAIALTTMGAAQDTNTETMQEDVPSLEEPELATPGALPGEARYGFTRAMERAEIAISRAPIIGGPEREAMVRSNHAEKRLSEANALFDRNDTERADRALNEFNRNNNIAAERANQSSNEELRDRIAQNQERQSQVLERVREKVPEQARQGIDNAIQNSQRNRDAMRGPPEGVGPGTTGPDNAGPQNGQPEDVGPNENEHQDTNPEDSNGAENGEQANQQNGEEQTDEETSDVREVEIRGGPGTTYNVEELQVEQGETVQFTYVHEGGQHDLVIERNNERVAGTEVLTQSGDQESFTYTFEEDGDYEFFCSVGSHRAQGMEGTISLS